MFGDTLAWYLRGEPDMMAAQAVQSMKSLHQYALTDSWRIAWPWTYTADPLYPHRTPGQEQEQEAILSYLKTEDELARRSLHIASGAQPQALSSSEEGNGDSPKPKKKGRNRDKNKDKKKAEGQPDKKM